MSGELVIGTGVIIISAVLFVRNSNLKMTEPIIFQCHVKFQLQIRYFPFLSSTVIIDATFKKRSNLKDLTAIWHKCISFERASQQSGNYFEGLFVKSSKIVTKYFPEAVYIQCNPGQDNSVHDIWKTFCDFQESWQWRSYAIAMTIAFEGGALRQRRRTL